MLQVFTVKAGHIRKGVHSAGDYLLYGAGPHAIWSPYVRIDHTDISLTNEIIQHGNRAIVTVPQGFVGMANDRGEPVLLPPGLHQWKSDSLKFEKMIDLATSVILLGPYTLVTVDEGYAAVTSNNGEQKVLDGGSAQMLTHRNWKFEKFITTKIQTSELGPIKMTSGDNVPLSVVATITWRIDDVAKAARMAATTMQSQRPSNEFEFDISQVRQDVLRQVTASLAAFVGTIAYAINGSASMAERVAGRHSSGMSKAQAEPDPEDNTGPKALFDRDGLDSSVDHANDVCAQYGVRVLAINLISAYPSDSALLAALSQGAVAAATAQQCRIEAQGQAAALLSKARAEAEATRIRAEGDAAAEELRAEGTLKAARKLEASDVAVMVARMRAAGAALSEGQANSFFFGLSGAGDLPAGVLGANLVTNSAAKSK